MSNSNYYWMIMSRFYVSNINPIFIIKIKDIKISMITIRYNPSNHKKQAHNNMTINLMKNHTQI